MNKTIQEQQALFTEVLEKIIHIEASLDKQVIPVPDIRKTCVELRTDLLRIIELEQEIMIEYIRNQSI